LILYYFCGVYTLPFIKICINANTQKERVLSKLNFEKTFDKVEHSAILQIMDAMGSPQRWVNYIRSFLSLDISFVLLNGVPGKEIICKRGAQARGPPFNTANVDHASHLVNCGYNTRK
jgi:hypothetical protein